MQTTTYNTTVRYENGYTYQVTEVVTQNCVGKAKGKERKTYYVSVLLSDATQIYTTPVFTKAETALDKAREFIKFAPGFLFVRTEQGGYKVNNKLRNTRSYYRIRDDKSGMEEV